MLPDPIISFSLFGRDIEIYMYGICIAVGLICCLLTFYALTKKRKMPNELQDFIFFMMILGVATGFLFAKLFQAIYVWADTKVFDFKGAGLTVMGGLIGGASCFLLFYFLIGHFYFKGKKKQNLHIKHFSTLIAVAPICICVAHGFGRIGCLMSGCCHGALLGETYVVGGIRMHGTQGWGYYVPIQLYESLFLFVLAGVLTLLYFKRSNYNMSAYLIGYAIWRFIIEIFRRDYRGGSDAVSLSPSQVQAIVFVALGVAIIILYLILKIPFLVKKEESVEKVTKELSDKVEKEKNKEVVK